MTSRERAGRLAHHFREYLRLTGSQSARDDLITLVTEQIDEAVADTKRQTALLIAAAATTGDQEDFADYLTRLILKDVK